MDSRTGNHGTTSARVVFVNHVAIHSGGEIALARLVDAVRDEVEAHVVLGEEGPLVERLREAGATVRVLPLASSLRDVRKETVRPGALALRTVLSLVRYVWTLRGVIREIQPDVVHTNSLKAALYGGVAGRLAGRRVVWHVRDRIADDYLPGPAVLLVRALSLVVPHAVVANSASTLATLPRSRRRPGAVVPDPLPTGLAQESRAHPGFRIGVVGRLTEWKGQHVFLDAFARAFADGDECAVLVGSAMFGEVEYAAGLVAQAERLGIADRVDFRGFRDDVWAELADLDVLVHCSVTPEPFGQVVVEGMAAGVPVIAADAGGPAEVITRELDGLLVPPGDVEALAGALSRLRDDEVLRRGLADQARRTVTRYAPERSAEALLAAYAQVRR